MRYWIKKLFIAVMICMVLFLSMIQPVAQAHPSGMPPMTAEQTQKLATWIIALLASIGVVISIDQVTNGEAFNWFDSNFWDWQVSYEKPLWLSKADMLEDINDQQALPDSYVDYALGYTVEGDTFDVVRLWAEETFGLNAGSGLMHLQSDEFLGKFYGNSNCPVNELSDYEGDLDLFIPFYTDSFLPIEQCGIIEGLGFKEISYYDIIHADGYVDGQIYWLPYIDHEIGIRIGVKMTYFGDTGKRVAWIYHQNYYDDIEYKIKSDYVWMDVMPSTDEELKKATVLYAMLHDGEKYTFMGTTRSQTGYVDGLTISARSMDTGNILERYKTFEFPYVNDGTLSGLQEGMYPDGVITEQEGISTGVGVDTGEVVIPVGSVVGAVGSTSALQTATGEDITNRPDIERKARLDMDLDWTMKFPLSIPWDLARLIGLFQAEPEPTVIDAELLIYDDMKMPLHFDVGEHEGIEKIAKITRLIFKAAVAFFLILVTRKAMYL